MYPDLLTTLPSVLSQGFPNHLAIVDCETTGTNPMRQRITELAVVVVDDGVVSETWSTLINPEQPIPEGIQQLTGITSSMVKDAPRFKNIADELMSLLEARVLVAHNARFDHAFLKNEFERAGVKYKTQQLCSVKISRNLFSEVKGHSLDAIIKRFDIAVSNRHRALDDANAVYEFFLHVSAFFSDSDIALTCKTLMSTPSIPCKIDPQLIANLPNTAGVYYFYDDKGKLLYVGKSINIRDRVKSHFQQDYRNAKDLKMAQQISQVDFQTTLSDFGAQLHESAEIKKLAPLHNRRLVKVQRAYYLDTKHDEDGYLTIAIKPILLKNAITNAGIGLFRSQRQAQQAIQKLTREYGLCQQLTGLESRTNRPCFAFQLKRCLGACCGKEKPKGYNFRLQKALSKYQLKVWPWHGPIVIEENPINQDKSPKYYVVKNWCIYEQTYSLDSASEKAKSLLNQESANCITDEKEEQFDLDEYMILCRFLLQKKKYGKIYV